MKGSSTVWFRSLVDQSIIPEIVGCFQWEESRQSQQQREKKYSSFSQRLIEREPVKEVRQLQYTGEKPGSDVAEPHIGKGRWSYELIPTHLVRSISFGCSAHRRLARESVIPPPFVPFAPELPSKFSLLDGTNKGTHEFH